MMCPKTRGVLLRALVLSRTLVRHRCKSLKREGAASTQRSHRFATVTATVRITSDKLVACDLFLSCRS